MEIGAVASGHELTTAAAEEILRDGGNAFDAVIAAHFAACVVEPVLASLGAGGYLLAEPDGEAARVYDFFTQTPTAKPRGELDFYPIQADFGPTSQEFHIGRGSVAVPGSVRGLFDIHRDLGSLPMTRLLEPAIRHAKEGVVLNAMQAYIFDVVSPIYLASDATAAIYGSRREPGGTLREGEVIYQPQQAATLEALAREGDRLFYEGEIAAAIADFCTEGGLLTRRDLAAYQVEQREPLHVRYRDAELLINPPPSSGGTLIGFALSLLAGMPAGRQTDAARVGRLAEVMAMTNRARLDALDDGADTIGRLLDPALLDRYRREVQGQPFCSRGTTHISVVDASGNLASMTVSNGEGCGELLADTGIMLNNVLGEEDLNPGGFFRWQPGARMTSMMAPAILHTPRGRAVLGSGGSNRLRTAILQVILNLVDFEMSIEEAVAAPRVHLEHGELNLEPGSLTGEAEGLERAFGHLRQWPEANLYFGGVHSVWLSGDDFHAAGDHRRGGRGRVVTG
jgi:gamma-glutamyltranspeptidase/glutathione hydrolase